MPGVPFILVGNKLDLAAQAADRYVGQRRAKKVAKNLGARASFQCSAIQEAENGNGNVRRVFRAAIKVGLNVPLSNPFCVLI